MTTQNQKPIGKKGRKKVKIVYVYESLFNSDIALIICDYKDFLSEAKQMLVEDKYKELEEMAKDIEHKNFTRARQFPLSGGGSLIWGNPKLENRQLVHELVHAGNHLLACRAIPLSEDTEEVYAYLLEFLYASFLPPNKRK